MPYYAIIPNLCGIVGKGEKFLPDTIGVGAMRNKKPLVEQSKIHFFAIKWRQKLQAPVPYNSEEFAEDCFRLGFDMNCGFTFKVSFQDENVFYQSESLKQVIGHIEDVKLLCSAIFSRWRDIQFNRIKEGFYIEQSRAEQSRAEQSRASSLQKKSHGFPLPWRAWRT